MSNFFPYFLFSCPKINFGPLIIGQLHTPDVTDLTDLTLNIQMFTNLSLCFKEVVTHSFWDNTFPMFFQEYLSKLKNIMS